jgi:membrane associated rhomboid family serine protease
MTASSVVLGLAGIVLLFAPEMLLATLGILLVEPLPVLIQLLAAQYFAFAVMNWTAKESAIGGIYNRPLSFGNFAHFFVGALVLIRHLFSNSMGLSLVVATLVYAIFAALFAWLLFRHSGLPSTQS